MEPKVYVPGQDRKADDLIKLYDKINVSPAAERTIGEERSVNDPFGIEKRGEPKDDYEAGKSAAERFTKFFGLLVQDFELAPRAALFAAELTFLNIFNSDDLPLPEAEVEAARKAAFEYYSKSRELIPSAAKR